MKVSSKKRYLYFIIGVFLTALGISFITKAGLGTSAIASPAYILTYLTSYSFGVLSFLISFLMVVMQIIILKNDFAPTQLLQFPAGLLMGLLIDLYMFLMSGWNPTVYSMRLIILLTGVITLGLGVAFQVIGDVLMLPAEGLVRALSKKHVWEFGRMKTLFDILLVVISIFISLFYLNNIVGVREGTVITAIATGYFSRFFQNILKKLI